MTRKTPPKRVRAKQKRLSPDDRRREFVAKATEFFSEEGFGGGTRALARRLGVTQPLLYRYFPSKDDLIKEVYRTVYLEPLDTGWEKLLADRSRPIRERLQEFYKTSKRRFIPIPTRVFRTLVSFLAINLKSPSRIGKSAAFRRTKVR